MDEAEVKVKRLRQGIISWDGKSTAAITELYLQHRTADLFIDQLTALLNDAEAQCGASWLLKYHCEQALQKTQRLSGEIATTVIDSLAVLDKWQAKLHILQTLPYLELSCCDQQRLEHFLRAGLTDLNKFVRAWSYNGFYLFAKQYPEYQREVAKMLEMALRDEPA